MSEWIFHEHADEALAEYFTTAAWKYLAAPARTKQRRVRPSWAETLMVDRDAQVTFDHPIACPSCGVLVAGLDGGRGEIDDGGFVDVIQCRVCRAMVVLDLRYGTLRAPTDHERKRWRLTFWFVVMRDFEGD